MFNPERKSKRVEKVRHASGEFRSMEFQSFFGNSRKPEMTIEEASLSLSAQRKRKFFLEQISSKEFADQVERELSK
jgi:hypothetical protein